MGRFKVVLGQEAWATYIDHAVAMVDGNYEMHKACHHCGGLSLPHCCLEPSFRLASIEHLSRRRVKSAVDIVESPQLTRIFSSGSAYRIWTMVPIPPHSNQAHQDSSAATITRIATRVGPGESSGPSQVECRGQRLFGAVCLPRREAHAVV